PFAFCLLLYVIFRKRLQKKTGWKTHRGLILFLLACGFSGILPLMITQEQRTFYLFTGLPFLALAAGVWVLPQVRELRYETQMREGLRKTVTFSGLLLLVVAFVLTFLFAGEPKRDAALLHDLNLIAQETGKNKTISIPPAMYSNWGMTNYAMRFHQLALTTNKEFDWHISLAETQDSLYVASEQNKNMRMLHLYKKAGVKY
ncbi:MAG: hypothetical protein ACRCYO_14795, partial [Bacteroidia bacterium]